VAGGRARARHAGRPASAATAAGAGTLLARFGPHLGAASRRYDRSAGSSGGAYSPVGPDRRVGPVRAVHTARPPRRCRAPRAARHLCALEPGRPRRMHRPHRIRRHGWPRDLCERRAQPARLRAGRHDRSRGVGRAVPLRRGGRAISGAGQQRVHIPRGKPGGGVWPRAPDHGPHAARRRRGPGGLVTAEDLAMGRVLPPIQALAQAIGTVAAALIDAASADGPADPAPPKIEL